MAKATRVTIDLPPASYAILEQAAQDNGINTASAGSLILQAALARRVSGLVPKRPQKAKTGAASRATAETKAADDAVDPGSSAVPDAMPSPGPSQVSEVV